MLSVLAVALAVLLALGAAPRAAPAQSAQKIPRVGLLCPVFCRAFSIDVGILPEGQAFEAELRQRGYVEGRTIVLDRRAAGVAPDRLAAYATDLVRRQVDVIVAEGQAAVAAARAATTTVPIVMVAAGDPVETGLVQSLARPGGNITGLTMPFTVLLAKQLELLREMAPGVSHVLVLSTPTDPVHGRTIEGTAPAAAALGMRLELVELRARSYTELEGVVPRLSPGRSALLVLDPERAGEINQFAIVHRLPAVSSERNFASAGGLLAYGPNRFDVYRRAAGFIDRILKGASPAELPVEQPTRFELVVNRTTARALGLTIPPAVLARADEILE